MAGLDHFGFIAPFYERLIPLRSTELLIARAGLPTAGPLLDAGGGTGRVAQALRGLAAPLVVADESMEMLRQAARKDGLRTTRSLAERLPFADQSFACILMVDALHHVSNQSQTATELWRVLKPGGRLVIEEPDIRTSVVKLIALLEKIAMMRSHFLSPPRIAALFPFASARATIEMNGFNAWVIVEKIPPVGQ